VKAVGYLLNTPGGPAGEPGPFYNYILAGNGLFLEADKPLLRARLRLAEARVRGLRPLEPFLELRHGKIPAHLLALLVGAMGARPDREMFASIIWDGERYALRLPEQEADGGHVTYQTIRGTVVGIHSHGGMEAFFSDTDDRDDQSFLVSLVLGRVDSLLPQIRARLCVYGYLAPVRLGEVFEGAPSGLEELWNTDWRAGSPVTGTP
jgi:PRTRC genetic system protein A